uniref:Uncharacterized protein n=1 Tax=Rhizophora mucronata TaxID=61149 RepID=A0A2P2L7F3_RHIMU
MVIGTSNPGGLFDCFTFFFLGTYSILRTSLAASWQKYCYIAP